MNFITGFAHAGHYHTDEAASATNTPTIILFGGLIAVVAIVAITLIFLNSRKKSSVHLTDDEEK